jgi:hypothetical protein
MKEFNFKDALAGKPVITRDGRPVEIAGYNKGRNRLAGWINGELNQWTGGGKSITYTTHDLFMAQTERKEWVVRSSGGGIFVPFKTKQEAEIHHLVDMGGTIHEITIHE